MGKETPSDFQAEEESTQCLPQEKMINTDTLHASQQSQLQVSNPLSFEPDDELVEHLRRLLHPRIRSWVYHASVSTWKGQEYDLMEDLLQIALVKIINYLKHTQRYAIPIYSLGQLSTVIAKRCFLDLRRHDMRLQHFALEEIELAGLEPLDDPALQAEDNIYEEGLLITSAHIIATFPTKLRLAILTDLAYHTSFTQTPTALQQAFLDVGIDLQKYNQALPGTKAARNNQAALRSLAYKRLALEIAQQESSEAELDAPYIRESTELASIALHLQQTRQFVAAPEFQKQLRTRLVASRFCAPLPQTLLYLPEKREKSGSSFTSYPLAATKDAMHSDDHGELDTPEVLCDPELDQIAKLLRDAVSPVPIDPAFKDLLFQKLLKALRQQQDSQEVETK